MMTTELTARDIIDLLDLAPLGGEGGYLRETWVRRSDGEDAPDATCIYYLITPDSFSALHRLPHDEIFHFYLGDPCHAVSVESDGVMREAVLGQDIRSGMTVQRLVPGGSWQGAKLLDGGRWALLGTTMSPGFHPSGFELATNQNLRGLSPEVRATLGEFLAKPIDS